MRWIDVYFSKKLCFYSFKGILRFTTIKMLSATSFLNWFLTIKIDLSVSLFTFKSNIIKTSYFKSLIFIYFLTWFNIRLNWEQQWSMQSEQFMVPILLIRTLEILVIFVNKDFHKFYFKKSFVLDFSCLLCLFAPMSLYLSVSLPLPSFFLFPSISSKPNLSNLKSVCLSAYRPTRHSSLSPYPL